MTYHKPVSIIEVLGMIERNFEWTDDLVRKFVQQSGGFNMLMQDIDFRQFKAQHTGKKYPEGILSFRGGVNEFVMWHPDLVTYQEWCAAHLDKGMNSKIESVKNSSDETLTVGDETNFGKIFCFKIFEGLLLVGSDSTEAIAQNMNNVHPKKEIQRDDFYLLLIQLYPGLEDDGFLLHKTYEYFDIDKICLTESEKVECQKSYKKAIETISKILLLNSLMKNRFNTNAK